MHTLIIYKNEYFILLQNSAAECVYFLDSTTSFKVNLCTKFTELEQENPLCSIHFLGPFNTFLSQKPWKSCISHNLRRTS